MEKVWRTPFVIRRLFRVRPRNGITMSITINCAVISEIFLMPTNTRSLNTLSGLVLYANICNIWTSEPERFIRNPIQQIMGLNSLGLTMKLNIV
jgi:uncharacterized membrane protein